MSNGQPNDTQEFCARCGKHVTAQNKFCASCGHPREAPSKAGPPDRRTVLLIGATVVLLIVGILIVKAGRTVNKREPAPVSGSPSVSPASAVGGVSPQVAVANPKFWTRREDPSYYQQPGGHIPSSVLRDIASFLDMVAPRDKGGQPIPGAWHGCHVGSRIWTGDLDGQPVTKKLDDQMMCAGSGVAVLADGPAGYIEAFGSSASATSEGNFATNSEAIFTMINHPEWVIGKQMKLGMARLNSEYEMASRTKPRFFVLYHHASDYEVSLEIQDKKGYQGTMVLLSGQWNLPIHRGELALTKLGDAEYWSIFIAKRSQPPNNQPHAAETTNNSSEAGSHNAQPAPFAKSLPVSRSEILSWYNPRPKEIGTFDTNAGTVVYTYELKNATLELEEEIDRPDLVRASLKFNIPEISATTNTVLALVFDSAIFAKNIAGVMLDDSSLKRLGFDHAYDPGPDEIVNNGVRIRRFTKGGVLVLEFTPE